MASASADIRLARRNQVFDLALSDTTGQLLPADRQAVEAAITYLGDRYAVDEICLIRADGLETARWVGGHGVAAIADLSQDERQNNPAVLPTLPLADDAFYQSPPYVSPDSNRWVIGIATPIVLASGQHAGVLHFELPIQRFAAEMDANPFGGTSFTSLLDRSGRLLVDPRLAAFRSAAGTSTDPATGPFPLATAAGSASWRDAVERITSGDTGALTFDDGGTTYRVSYRPVPDSDRVVAVASPVNELYADVDRALLNLAVTAGPLIVLMIVVAGWFTRRMARANRGLASLNGRLASTNSRLEETSRTSADLAKESAIVNQFTELTALTEDDVSLSVATLATLDELLHPDFGRAARLEPLAGPRRAPGDAWGGRRGGAVAARARPLPGAPPKQPVRHGRRLGAPELPLPRLSGRERYGRVCPAGRARRDRRIGPPPLGHAARSVATQPAAGHPGQRACRADHREPAVAAGAPRSGEHGRPDRPDQQPRVRRDAGARARRSWRHPVAGGPDARSRPLQGLQRPPWPSGRRRGAASVREPAGLERPRAGRRRPLRRRGVRGVPGGSRCDRSRSRRRADPRAHRVRRSSRWRLA